MSRALRLSPKPVCPVWRCLPWHNIKKQYHVLLKTRHHKTLQLIFQRPVSGSVRRAEVEALFRALGAKISEAAGSRVCVRLFDDRRVFHRPHPSPDTDKGALASIRKWLETNGARP